MNGSSVVWWCARRVMARLRRPPCGARVAKAKEQVEALNRRGRGRRRFEEIAPLRQAASEIVQRHQVEGLLRLRYAQHTATRQVRAYGGRPAHVEQGRQATVEVEVDEAALGLAVRRLGWRVYSTNQPLQQLSLEQAVLAYRHEYLVDQKPGSAQRSPAVVAPHVRAARRPCHRPDSVDSDRPAGLDAAGVCGTSSVGGFACHVKRSLCG